METEQQRSHKGFLRRSGIYIALNFLTSLFELGFNGVSIRLPGDSYSTFWALLKIFFIVTVPLMGVQLVVSKEVASYSVLGELGKRRSFVQRTYWYTMVGALFIIILGLFASPLIAAFLRIRSLLPVLLMVIAIGFYFPLPMLYGTIQGLKKFYTLGLVQASWGFFRVIICALIVLVFAGRLNQFLVGIIAATIVTAIVSCIPVRSVFISPCDSIERHEISRAYWLILPVVAMLFCITTIKNADVVFARRFFESSAAQAYTCAALVGSAFFTLSAIFMVMFPMVSEEKTRGGNPIVILGKSLGFIIVLSFFGIAVAWFRPDVLMYIITLGKYVPGAEPLIRLIGFAVVPVSLVFVMSNYLLAKHHWRFIPVLIGGMLLQLIFILLVHTSPLKMLAGIITANTTTFSCMLIYLILEHRKYIRISNVES